MKIALLQINPVVGDIRGNVDAVIDGMREAARLGAELAITPELVVCGYPPRDLLERPAFVEAIGDALDRLAAAAPIPAVIGFVEHAAGAGDEPTGRRLRNAAAVIADGVVCSVHHKSLLPTYDVFDEWRYFEPGDRVTLAQVAGVQLGISICEDIWNDGEFWTTRKYPRDPVEDSVALGAQLLINISASPFAVGKRALRARMLGAQARKHGRPLLMVNQVGGNDDLVFDGASMAFSADGTLGARAREFASDLLLVDVDLETGQVSGPMAPAHAEGEQGTAAAALDALVMGVRDYVYKCGFKSVLLGLSGGIDSALTAAIAVRALGAENVHGVSLPSRYSSEHSRDDARQLAENLCMPYQTIAIEGPYAAALEAVRPAFDALAGEQAVGVAEENLQARCRGLLLMALSNKLGHLLLTTGNKSELAVGYCTLYGDMCGGLAVISDVPKTMVYELARELNRQAGSELIPRSTLEKPPSAELRPDQLDQDSLPPYDVLDSILERYIEGHRSREQIVAAGFAPEVVDRVLGLVRISEYKRTQAAPGIKIRLKSFGPGRRMPLAARWR